MAKGAYNLIELSINEMRHNSRFHTFCGEICPGLGTELVQTYIMPAIRFDGITPNCHCWRIAHHLPSICVEEQVFDDLELNRML